MKKLLLLMAMALFAVGVTSCQPKNEIATMVEFTVKADYQNTKENLAKIEDLIKSKGLPVGDTKVSVEGELADLEVKVKQMVAEFLTKVSAAELEALNTGATYVEYSGHNIAFSVPTITSRREL